jgi:hypothetical protein
MSPDQTFEVSRFELCGGHSLFYGWYFQNYPQQRCHGTVAEKYLFVKEQVLQVISFNGHHHHPVNRVNRGNHPFLHIFQMAAAFFALNDFTGNIETFRKLIITVLFYSEVMCHFTLVHKLVQLNPQIYTFSGALYHNDRFNLHFSDYIWPVISIK